MEIPPAVLEAFYDVVAENSLEDALVAALEQLQAELEGDDALGRFADTLELIGWALPDDGRTTRDALRTATAAALSHVLEDKDSES